MRVYPNNTLPREIDETVTRSLAQLTEELNAKFGPGFRQGVYVVFTAGDDGLPDGLWVVYPPKTDPELACGLLEAGHMAMKNLMDQQLLEKLHSMNQEKRNFLQQPEDRLSLPELLRPEKVHYTNL